MEVGVQHHAPAAFTLEKEHMYALKRKLGGTRRRSGGEKNVLYLTGFEHETFFNQYPNSGQRKHIVVVSDIQ
jgi:hypothetical protein